LLNTFVFLAPRGGDPPEILSDLRLGREENDHHCQEVLPAEPGEGERRDRKAEGHDILGGEPGAKGIEVPLQPGEIDSPIAQHTGEEGIPQNPPISRLDRTNCKRSLVCFRENLAAFYRTASVPLQYLAQF